MLYKLMGSCLTVLEYLSLLDASTTLLSLSQGPGAVPSHPPDNRPTHRSISSLLEGDIFILFT